MKNHIAKPWSINNKQTYAKIAINNLKQTQPLLPMELGKKQELEKEAKEYFQNSKKEIIRSVKNDQVVPLDFYHLSKFSPMLSEKLLETPEEIIALLELCLEEQAYLPKPPRIRFTSLPDSVKIKIK